MSLLLARLGVAAVVTLTAPAATIDARTGAEVSVAASMTAAPAAMSVATGASMAALVTMTAAPATMAAEAACSASASVACSAAPATFSAASSASAAMAVACVAPAAVLSAEAAASTVCTVDMSAAACTLQAYDLRGGAYPYTADVDPYARTVAVTPPTARSVDVVWYGAAVSVTIPATRGVSVTTDARSVQVQSRGSTVSRFSIYQGDNAPPLDVQVLDADGGVDCTMAIAVIEWTHQSGTTGTLTAGIHTASTGWWRHAWSAGETAALAVGNYTARITVTFPDTTVITYPSVDAPAILMTVAAR